MHSNKNVFGQKSWCSAKLPFWPAWYTAKICCAAWEAWRGLQLVKQLGKMAKIRVEVRVTGWKISLCENYSSLLACMALYAKSRSLCFQMQSNTVSITKILISFSELIKFWKSAVFAIGFLPINGLAVTKWQVIEFGQPSVSCACRWARLKLSPSSSLSHLAQSQDLA